MADVATNLSRREATLAETRKLLDGAETRDGLPGGYRENLLEAINATYDAKENKTRTEKNAVRGYRALWKKIQRTRRNWRRTLGRLFYRHFPDVLDFSLSVPWTRFRVRLLTRTYDRDVLYVLAFDFQFVRWGFHFHLGESRPHAVDRGAL